MTALDWYGLAGSALILLAFYFLRTVGAFIKACAVVAVATSVASFYSLASVSVETLLQASVTSVGLSLCAFGLLIVRVMFIRSVSLNLLRNLQAGVPGGFDEDIGGRLNDMRRFGLIESEGELTRLSSFGRLIGGVVERLYALLRVKA